MRTFKKVVLCVTLCTMLLANTIMANASEPKSSSDVSAETGEVAVMPYSTQVSSASGSLEPGETKRYYFSVSRATTLKFYAGGSYVDSSEGGGNLSFLAGNYPFNDYTGCVATVTVQKGSYSYSVGNPKSNNRTITFGVVVMAE